jgi:hypothetical protein
VPAGTTFTHPVSPGHTVFAYVIDGSAYFDEERNPFAHEVIGNNYFATSRETAGLALKPLSFMTVRAIM